VDGIPYCVVVRNYSGSMQLHNFTIVSSIHKRGAGLGPAINILAIILTARILGFELGIARIIGAVIFSVLIGIIMSLIYRKEEKERAEKMDFPDIKEERPLWQISYHFFVLVLILVFANWGKPDTNEGFMFWLYVHKWQITAFFGLMFMYSLIKILKMKPLYVLLAAIPVIATALIFPVTAFNSICNCCYRVNNSYNNITG